MRPKSIKGQYSTKYHQSVLCLSKWDSKKATIPILQGLWDSESHYSSYRRKKLTRWKITEKAWKLPIKDNGWETVAPSNDLCEPLTINLVSGAPLFLVIFSWTSLGRCGKCQVVDWQRMKGCGWGNGVEGANGAVERRGRKKQCRWGLQTLYLPNMSSHFQQVQSQFMKQSTSI